MQIPKDAVLTFLRERGQSDQAGQAEQELPDQVDTERDAGLLAKFGVDDPKELVGSAGDRLPGGLGDKLGGL